MALLYQRLDDRITQGSFGTVRIPGRTKSYNPAGKLFQNFLATRPVHIYDYAHGVRTRDDFQAVLDAFYVVLLTPYDGLLHRDWRDYIATKNNSNCSVVDSVTLQLQRKHKFGAAFYLRSITKPCASPSIVVYRTRSGIESVASVTIDTTTGLATVTGHTTGDTYTWEGQFDIPVTFTDNEWVATLEVSVNNLYVTSAPIKLEELI